MPAVPDVQGMLQWHFPTAKTRRKQSAQLKPVKPATKLIREMLDAVLCNQDRLQASWPSAMHTIAASQAAALAVAKGLTQMAKTHVLSTLQIAAQARCRGIAGVLVQTGLHLQILQHKCHAMSL